MAAAAIIQANQKAADEYINQYTSIANTINNAFEHDIDDELRNQLKADGERLLHIDQREQQNNRLYSGVWDDLNNIINSVNRHIESYNYRVAAEYRRQTAEMEKQRLAEQEQIRQQAIQEEAQRRAGWSGTGFALNQGYVVTNYHVIEDANTILVKELKATSLPNIAPQSLPPIKLMT